jgi:hypothetical protein
MRRKQDLRAGFKQRGGNKMEGSAITTGTFHFTHNLLLNFEVLCYLLFLAFFFAAFFFFAIVVASIRQTKNWFRHNKCSYKFYRPNN